MSLLALFLLVCDKVTRSELLACLVIGLLDFIELGLILTELRDKLLFFCLKTANDLKGSVMAVESM